MRRPTRTPVVPAAPDGVVRIRNLMHILLTNDDGYRAPGLLAAFRALAELGRVSVVAPHDEQSACSHKITMDRPITVRRMEHPGLGSIQSAEGTPADCVRLAVVELLDEKPDVVVAGINHGANAGVDTFYSGTVGGAREGAILGIPAIALSQAYRRGVEPDWDLAAKAVAEIVPDLLKESLPGPGFWSVNLPAPIPDDFADRIHRTTIALEPMPFNFEKVHEDGVARYAYPRDYWSRRTTKPSDYTVIRDGGISITAVPLVGRF